MGKETKAVKDRTCKHCGLVGAGTAQQLAEHAAMRKIATRMGIVLVGQQGNFEGGVR